MTLKVVRKTACKMLSGWSVPVAFEASVRSRDHPNNRTASEVLLLGSSDRSVQLLIRNRAVGAQTLSGPGEMLLAAVTAPLAN